MDDRRRDELWQWIVQRAIASDGVDLPRAVCVVCVSVAADGAAITLRAESRIEEMIAADAAWAAGLDEAQYTVGEGPGVEAFGARSPVLVADMAVHGERWPAFADLAAGEGVAAVFAVPLQIGGIRLGTLDLYRRRAGRLTPTELGDVLLLAEFATNVVLHEADWEYEQDEISDLRVGSYQDVHIATGMLAVQLQISLEDAFIRLRAHAFTEGRSLLKVSRDVMAQRLRLDQRTE